MPYVLVCVIWGPLPCVLGVTPPDLKLLSAHNSLSSVFLARVVSASCSEPWLIWHVCSISFLLSLWGRHLYPASRWGMWISNRIQTRVICDRIWLWTEFPDIRVLTTTLLHLTWTERIGQAKKQYLGRKKEDPCKEDFPSFSPQLSSSPDTNMIRLPERICTSCLSNLFPFCPSLVIARGQMEILTSHQIPENENACGKSAPSLWLHPCASFACPPGLHNLLILWRPTVLEVAHLCFQQILPMVWCGMVTCVCLISLLPDQNYSLSLDPPFLPIRMEWVPTLPGPVFNSKNPEINKTQSSESRSSWSGADRQTLYNTTSI